MECVLATTVSGLHVNGVKCQVGAHAHAFLPHVQTANGFFSHKPSLSTTHLPYDISMMDPP